MNKYKFDVIVNHLQTYGFFYQGSEIYDGLANSWDYGPLGVELINNLKRMWWKKYVQETTTNVGIDSSIFMNPKVWEATGHISAFNDPLIDCKSCKMRFRADQLVDDKQLSHDLKAIKQLFEDGKITCPNCGKNQFTDIRKFNMMFKTHLGPSEDSQSLIYLRPETAQGIFVNFKNIMRTTRRKVPFGVASIGKAFRNEITTGNFVFRTREFTQLELEFFCKPGTNEEWFKYWKEYSMNFLYSIGISAKNLRFRDHDKNELSFYSQATSDIEYQFPFGWDEIWGIADRGDYDLKQHQKFSGKPLDYLDVDTNEKFIPFVIEPSLGLDRLALSSLVEAYEEEQLQDDKRIVLRLHNALAPYKAAVLPLSRQLNEKALEVVHILNKHFMIVYDETGSIGKRYRRQDAIGTPYCITIDFDTSKDQTVTIRERDSMKQIRLPIDELIKYLTVKVYY